MRAAILGLSVAVVGIVAPPLVFADRCNQVSTITDASGGSETTSDLSDSAAVICSVEFFANGADGWAAIWDTPDDTTTHAQALVKAEPGAATAGNSESRWYGAEGRPTRFGLDVEVVNGTVIIEWAGASP